MANADSLALCIVWSSLEYRDSKLILIFQIELKYILAQGNDKRKGTRLCKDKVPTDTALSGREPANKT